MNYYFYYIITQRNFNFSIIRVILSKAGTPARCNYYFWIPAYAGMTKESTVFAEGGII
ncbi:MAG: hypothetical protein AABZ43_06415 [Planctomycetota bacterium]